MTDLGPAGWLRSIGALLGMTTTTNLDRDPDDPYDAEADRPFSWLVGYRLTVNGRLVAAWSVEDGLARVAAITAPALTAEAAGRRLVERGEVPELPAGEWRPSWPDYLPTYPPGEWDPEAVAEAEARWSAIEGADD